MRTSTPDTDQLLLQAHRGDQRAVDEVLARQRPRLRHMIALRMDRRLGQRCDPSDVVQEALIEAAGKLPQYLEERPLPFYPWLREIAWERLVQLHRWHFAQKRSVALEEHWQPSDQSVTTLASRLVGHGDGPASRAVHQEAQARMRAALTLLSASDRDLLLMRYAEQLRVREIAALLELSEPAVKSRVRRALERLHSLLSDDGEDSS